MPSHTARQAADDLRTVRERWGDLLAAIDTPPDPVWPPRECRSFLATGRTDDAAELLVADRAPLTLREHPAPLNLGALDAALFVERGLFDLADTLAAAVQRPARRRTRKHPGGRTVAEVDAADRDDPARWTYASPTDPGSRRHGLHWAAVWIEGRALGDQLDGGLFARTPGHLLHETARVARAARRRVEGVFGGAQRAVPVPDRPCPWCGGELLLHTDPDGPPSVTCGQGFRCGAPVPVVAHGRVWEWHALPALIRALDGTPGPGGEEAARIVYSVQE